MAWQQLNSDAPVDALGSTHALHRAIARWQSALVREAIDGGASWEDIGAALGTTKQAAWARFRGAIEGRGGRAEVEERDDRKRQWKQLWESGQARLREMEAAWRAEERRMRDELRTARDRLSEQRRHHARERREARRKLRQEVLAARRTGS